MNYSDSLNYIHSLLRFGSKPGLERIGALLENLGNPQKELKVIHVAGTNGKGSVCKMLSTVLQKAGYKVGLYISPYVVNFRERIQINGNFIPEDQLCYFTEKVKKVSESLVTDIEATEFEFITALAFEYFKEENCDYVVLETGLGGRFDATNVIEKPMASVITKIDLEHTELLGDTIAKIAFEKGGIIKQGCPLITSSINPKDSLDVFEEICKNISSPIFFSEYNEITDAKSDINGNYFKYKGEEFFLPIAGVNQFENVAIVLKILEVVFSDISIKTIKSALKNVSFPARCELISSDPVVVLDGSHNPNGVSALNETLGHILNNKAVAIIGFMADKDIDTALSKILSKFSKVITVTVDGNPRSITADDLKQKCLNLCDNVQTADSYDEAVLLAKKENKPIIVFGSLYLAGDIREILIKTFREDKN